LREEKVRAKNRQDAKIETERTTKKERDKIKKKENRKGERKRDRREKKQRERQFSSYLFHSLQILWCSVSFHNNSQILIVTLPRCEGKMMRRDT